MVIRGGIVVPWEAVSALTALATDPERDTAGRALTCLRGVVAANTAFVAGQVPQGVAEAYAFHCRLAALERPGQPPALGGSQLQGRVKACCVACFSPNGFRGELHQCGECHSRDLLDAYRPEPAADGGAGAGVEPCVPARPPAQEQVPQRAAQAHG